MSQNNIRPWFADDIAHLIKSVLFVAREAESEEYKRGFLACALTLCMAFGIDLPIGYDPIKYYAAQKPVQNQKPHVRQQYKNHDDSGEGGEGCLT